VSFDPKRPPDPYITRENPDFAAWVEHRAIELCVDASPEDHTNARPCFTHLHDARREGLAAWRRRGGGS
jgi:hypothetical protein